MWITSSPKAAKAPAIIALGNFDGVHLGHQRVMAKILPDRQSLASSLSQRLFCYPSITALHGGLLAAGYSHVPEQFCTPQSVTASGLEAKLSVEQPPYAPPTPSYQRANADSAPLTYATVVTFFPHPQEYFSGTARPLLTPLVEKTWLLAQLGIQQLVLLPFDQALANLTPEDFVVKLLIEQLQAKSISVGSDFRFGKGRSGDAAGLSAIASQYGIPVIQAPLREEAGARISSSRIRQALQLGELDMAAHLLGRPYSLTGKVVPGQQLGRTLGFPTANLKLPPDKYLPRMGVYGVQVHGPAPEPLPAVMNIGYRPTVEGQALAVEVHLLNWSGDLYGQFLTVTLECFLRPEQRFDSLAQLQAQIAQDAQAAIACLLPNSSSPQKN